MVCIHTCLLLIETNTSQVTTSLKHHQNDATLKTEMPLIVHWPVHVDVHRNRSTEDRNPFGAGGMFDAEDLD